MSLLSPAGQALVTDIAARHGFSAEAVTHMLVAVHQGGGSQAQFNHWEFGGMGQWSMGGMSMIGDMFNNALKGRVDALCADLSSALANTQVFQPAAAQSQSTSYQGQSQGTGMGQGQAQGGGMQMQGNGMGSMGMGGFGGGSSLFVPSGGMGPWWPESLGQPGSTGAQNDLKYAYFPQTARLAIQIGGRVTVYDTGPHQISGFGQQQSGDQSLSFTSQHGLVRVADLPVVKLAAGDDSPAPQEPDTPDAPSDAPPEVPQDAPTEVPQETPSEAPTAPPQELPRETPAEVPIDRPVETPASSAPSQKGPQDVDAIFAALEKLGALRDMGVLTEAEFDAKKQELLARI